MRPSLRLALSIALALLTPAALAADRDISKVNGSVTVEDNGRAGDLETVNGSIRVGDHARAGDATTVNGSIRVGASSQVGDLTTVNGGIRVESDTQVNGDVETVNGGIFIGRGGKVRGGVETVNGAIGLVDVDLGGGIETVRGDITVGAGSHVRGGIHYPKPSKEWVTLSARKDPRVIIGANAVVEGPLLFERKVQLYVHESARIGTVTGAQAQRYSGAKPALKD